MLSILKILILSSIQTVNLEAEEVRPSNCVETLMRLEDFTRLPLSSVDFRKMHLTPMANFKDDNDGLTQLLLDWGHQIDQIETPEMAEYFFTTRFTNREVFTNLATQRDRQGYVWQSLRKYIFWRSRFADHISHLRKEFPLGVKVWEERATSFRKWWNVLEFVDVLTHRKFEWIRSSGGPHIGLDTGSFYYPTAAQIRSMLGIESRSSSPLAEALPQQDVIISPTVVLEAGPRIRKIISPDISLRLGFHDSEYSSVDEVRELAKIFAKMRNGILNSDDWILAEYVMGGADIEITSDFNQFSQLARHPSAQALVYEGLGNKSLLSLRFLAIPHFRLLYFQRASPSSRAP